MSYEKVLIVLNLRVNYTLVSQVRDTVNSKM